MSNKSNGFLFENFQPHEHSPYQWDEGRHNTESHELCPRSTIPVNPRLAHKAITRLTKSHVHRSCAREGKENSPE